MKNFFDFTDKTVLVTGASSGIGRATAELFGSLGARVAITYNKNEDGASAVVSGIGRSGGEAYAIRSDFTSMENVREAVAEAENSFGSAIDVLVNNAGSLVERLRTAELTEARWDEVYALNVKSAFFACQAALPKMLENGGAIVNVTSIAGRNGGALGSIHYSSAKAAMLVMTKGLAKEFGGQGIRINGISPGVIDTPFHETFSTPEAMKNFANMIPMGRVGTSAEVAKTIAFIASEAASYLCGETIEINGGMLMD